MLLFRIISECVSFDEDEAMVVLASSQDEALELAKKNWVFREGKTNRNLICEYVDQSKAQIICVSHYGD